MSATTFGNTTASTPHATESGGVWTVTLTITEKWRGDIVEWTARSGRHVIAYEVSHRDAGIDSAVLTDALTSHYGAESVTYHRKGSDAGRTVPRLVTVTLPAPECYTCGTTTGGAPYCGPCAAGQERAERAERASFDAFHQWADQAGRPTPPASEPAALVEHTPAVLAEHDVPGQLGIDVPRPGQCELPLALPAPPPRTKRTRPAAPAQPIPGQLGFGD